MNEQLQHHDTNVIEQAMSEFLMAAVSAKSKHTRIKANMECRRKLEIKWEEKRLARETLEFDFN